MLTEVNLKSVGAFNCFLALHIPGPFSVSLFSRVSFQPRSQVLSPGWERTLGTWLGCLCSSFYGYSTISE